MEYLKDKGDGDYIITPSEHSDYLYITFKINRQYIIVFIKEQDKSIHYSTGKLRIINTLYNNMNHLAKAFAQRLKAII